jgi:hypothetical protein
MTVKKQRVSLRTMAATIFSRAIAELMSILDTRSNSTYATYRRLYHTAHLEDEQNNRLRELLCAYVLGLFL